MTARTLPASRSSVGPAITRSHFAFTRRSIARARERLTRTGRSGSIGVMPDPVAPVPARRPFEPRDITRIRWIADPHISPDGRRVAFVVTTLSEDRDEYLSSVWMVDTGGGEPRQFTNGPKRDTAPRWSPDGTRLAFPSARHDARDEDDARDVWMVDAAGGGDLQKLTDTGGPVALPAFSPDGRRVAYLGRRPLNEIGRNLRLYTVAVGGGVPACLTSDLDRSCPANIDLIWSSDGEWVTFSIE